MHFSRAARISNGGNQETVTQFIINLLLVHILGCTTKLVSETFPSVSRLLLTRLINPVDVAMQGFFQQLFFTEFLKLATLLSTFLLFCKLSGREQNLGKLSGGKLKIISCCHTYPLSTPKIRLSTKNEPQMIRVTKYIQGQELPETLFI